MREIYLTYLNRNDVETRGGGGVGGVGERLRYA